MADVFASRMNNLQKSFIREILKVTENPEVISFAGGLPNPKFFPVGELAAASAKVLGGDGQRVLQYSTTEGYNPLRAYIAARYRRRGLDVSPDEILITNGSQQGLDLVGKIFLNPNDSIILERPGYLGAIQAFSMYEAQFLPVSMNADGIDTEALKGALQRNQPKLYYAVVNFQNPSGITYSDPKRRNVADLLRDEATIMVEDDPYGELRFDGENLPSMRHYLGDNVVLLGSFSKVIAPGIRLGWICAKPNILERLVVAKQAADLHSNYLAQRLLYQYLIDNDLDEHLTHIKTAYKKQRDLMVSLMETLLPEEVRFTRPEGGMFVWATLAEGLSSLELFEYAAKMKVVFVPGRPFYVDGGGENTFRLSYSNSDEAKIETGVTRLAQAVKEMLVKQSRFQLQTV